MTPTRSSCFSLSLIVALCVGSTRVESLQLRHYPKVSVPHGVSPETAPQQHDTTSRRKGLALLLFGAPALLSRAAWAASTSVEFQNVGQQAPLPAGETNAFVTLDNGVQVKTYREGTGTDVVKVVAVVMSRHSTVVLRQVKSGVRRTNRRKGCGLSRMLASSARRTVV